MNDDTINSILERIRPSVRSAAIGHLDEDGYFLFTLKAAFIKNFEFNSLLATQGQLTTASFLCPFLRGLCEDVIGMAYYARFRPPDRDRVILLLSLEQTFSFVEKQHAFFGDHHPAQHVVAVRASSPQAEKVKPDQSSAIRSQLEMLREPYGPKRPTIRHMADAVGTLSLYDYLYAATSSFVHFSPRNLQRMAWGDERMRVFEFSTKNFGKYFEAFNRFYGLFLLVTFCTKFATELSVRKDIESPITDLIGVLRDQDRWPELVTFEELNWSQMRPSEVLASPFRLVVGTAQGVEVPAIWRWA